MSVEAVARPVTRDRVSRPHMHTAPPLTLLCAASSLASTCDLDTAQSNQS